MDERLMLNADYLLLNFDFLNYLIDFKSCLLEGKKEKCIVFAEIIISHVKPKKNSLKND